MWEPALTAVHVYSFTYIKASIHGQRDMSFRRTGHRRIKQHKLSYWVILKRKLGFQETVVDIQKSMGIFHLNEENYFVMQTTIKFTRNYLLSKGHFQSTDFKSRANPHSMNKQDSGTGFCTASHLSSLVDSSRGNPRSGQVWIMDHCTQWDFWKLQTWWALKPISNGLENFCHRQTLFIRIFPKDGEEAEGQRKQTPQRTTQSENTSLPHHGCHLVSL